MSTTVATYPIVAALVEAEKMTGMGSNRQWWTRNATQVRFLTDFFSRCRDEIGGIPEIESIASWSVDEVNAFLHARGFTIELQPFDENTFGVASVLDLMVEWLVKGKATTVHGIDGVDYPGVHIVADGVQIYDAVGHTHPIAHLFTKAGDRVYMTRLDRALGDGFDLIAMAEALSDSLTRNRDYGGLVFPMVDLDHEVDIRWLLEMHTMGVDGRPARITQALQQTKLRMSEVGARAQSAVAMAVTREAFAMPKPDMVIDGPCLVWFERDGLAKQLFVGHITTEHWRNPGDLGK